MTEDKTREIKKVKEAKKGKEVQNSTITHVEKDWFIAVEPDGKWYKIWNTGKREEVEPPQDTTIQDVVNGTPKGQAAVEKAIKDSIEVQNSMTKKAQDTSLDFIGCCGGGLARHEVCSHVKAYIKEEQAKLSQVIEDEVILVQCKECEGAHFFKAVPLEALKQIKDNVINGGSVYE